LMTVNLDYHKEKGRGGCHLSLVTRLPGVLTLRS
jgi:hypothetical protein